MEILTPSDAGWASKFQFASGALCESGLGEPPNRSGGGGNHRWSVSPGPPGSVGLPASDIRTGSLLLPVGDPPSLTLHVGHGLCLKCNIWGICV